MCPMHSVVHSTCVTAYAGAACSAHDIAKHICKGKLQQDYAPVDISVERPLLGQLPA